MLGKDEPYVPSSPVKIDREDDIKNKISEVFEAERKKLRGSIFDQM